MTVVDRDRWRTLEPLLDEALELEPDDRTRWLHELGRRDPDVAADLVALLAGDEHAEQSRFLERPVNVTLAGLELDGWRLERPLGYGGMGSVWLARRSDGRFEGNAAIKLLSLALVDDVGVARFRREGSTLARLTHPGIARLLDAGVTPQGQPYLVLEYVEGTPIDVWVRERGLSTQDRVRLFLDVLDVVAHAHASLVVHRDLKPANILITPSGQVKLLDFGIARLLDDDRRQLTEGWRALTPEYAAPEQVSGSGDVTTATDIYAAGVLLYVLLSGRHPTAEGCNTPAEVLAALVDSQPRALGLGDLDTVLAKALRKEPSERYPTVAAFADDLTRWLRHLPVQARPHSFAYRARKFARRNRLPVAIGVAAIALSAVYVSMMASDRIRLRRALDEAMINAQRAEQVSDFTVGMFEATGSSRGPAYADSVSARDLLDRAGQRAGELASQPLLRAQMLDLIGRIRAQLGDLPQARAALEEALAVRRQFLGEQHSDVATTMITLAQVLNLSAEDTSGLPLLRRALTIRRSLFGNDDPRTANALYALATTMHQSGDYKSAKPIMDEWMAIVQRLPIRYTPEMSEQLHNAATVLTYSRRLPEAERLTRRAMSIDSSWYGAEHSRVGTDLSLLGSIIGDQGGRTAEAEGLYHRGIDVLRRAYPKGSPDLAYALRNHAFLLTDLRRFQEAEPIWREAVALFASLGRAEDLSYSTSLSMLAKTLIGMERYAEADSVLRIAFRQPSMKRPPPNIILTRARLYAAFSQVGQGRFKEAESVLKENFDVKRRFGFVRSDMQMTSEALIRIYEAQGRPDEAAKYRLPDSLTYRPIR